MKIQLRTLRNLIREIFLESKKRKYDFGGSQPEEDYEEELLNDPSYKKKSVYVPDDIKSSIDKWATDMGLKGGKK